MLDAAERASLKHEFARRRRTHEQETIPGPMRPQYEDSGWTVLRKNKNSVRMKREKSHDAAFEDKMWSVLYQMEFEELNVGRDFRIPIGKGPRPKQIDVFGLCRFGAVIIECKSAENITARRLRKDVAEYIAVRDRLADAINAHAGRDVDLAVVFATRNIEWSQSDLDFALENGVHVLRDDDIDYYGSLASHLGAGAQYQFFADAFGGQKSKAESVQVAALRGSIGGSEVFVFAARASELLPISHIAHRAKVDRQTVTAYQRMVQKARLKSIRAYIEENGALFPNAVILNFHDPAQLGFASATNDQQGWTAGTLTLPTEYRSAWVIDGQHRLMGLAGSADVGEAALPVVAFSGLDSATQAKIFVDINSKQVRVQNNLLEELYADLLWSSTDPVEQLAALCAKTVGILDKERSSPLCRRIKSGSKVNAKGRPITITTVSTALKKSRLYGHVPPKAVQIDPGPLLDVVDPFMENSLRRGVAAVIGYLSFFSKGAPDHWELGDAPGGYLCTNNGLVALLIVFQRTLEHAAKEAGVSPRDWSPEQMLDHVYPLVEPIVRFFRNASPADIHGFRRLLGASGQVKASLAMMALVHDSNADFVPKGLGQYLASQDDQYTDRARVVLPKLQVAISQRLLKMLRQTFGEDDDGWWAQGVPQQVRIKVAQRRESDPERPRLDQSFDLLDYKAIANANWELLGEDFGIPKDASGKAKQLAWFQTLNDLRKRVAHPERGQVSKEELEWIQSVARDLRQSIGSIDGLTE